MPVWRSLNRLEHLSPGLVGDRSFAVRTILEVSGNTSSAVSAQFRPRGFSASLNDITVTMSNPGYVKTTSALFRGNKVLGDGREPEPDSQAQIAGAYAIRLSAGTHLKRGGFSAKLSWPVFLALLLAYSCFERVARTFLLRRHPGQSVTRSCSEVLELRACRPLGTRLYAGIFMLSDIGLKQLR